MITQINQITHGGGKKVRVLTTVQVARALQISRDTVVRLIESGELSSERLTLKGNYRIREDDLKEYAKRRGVKLIEQLDK